MSVREFLFGNSKKNESELTRVMDGIAEAHLNPNHGTKRVASGKERGLNSDNQLYEELERILIDFLNERNDFEGFTKIMHQLNENIKSPDKAVEYYVELFREEEFRKLESINNSMTKVDAALANVLEQGLNKLEDSARERESLRS